MPVLHYGDARARVVFSPASLGLQAQTPGLIKFGKQKSQYGGEGEPGRGPEQPGAARGRGLYDKLAVPAKGPGLFLGLFAPGSVQLGRGQRLWVNATCGP